jgi:thiosulfate/3-mercaptopyruvate sulfurtransferase
MRSAAILLYAGVRDVRILNGGLNQWQEAGFPVSTEEKKPEPKSEFGAQIPARPEVFIDMPKAKELLKADDGELVSIRSWEEFIGNVSGYNYIGKTGRIPGAVFGNCGSDAYHMENYRNPDHTMRSFHETAAGWTENDIVPKKHIAFYCGTGWRASEAFWNAYLMGWPKVSIYDGGWFEWSNDPDNPVETGEPE